MGLHLVRGHTTSTKLHSSGRGGGKARRLCPHPSRQRRKRRWQENKVSKNGSSFKLLLQGGWRRGEEECINKYSLELIMKVASKVWR